MTVCSGADHRFMTVIEPRYQRHVATVAPMSPKPEMRLELSVIAAWCMTIAMFWFGWTSYHSIHWISPMFAAVLLGFGVLGALDSAGFGRIRRRN